MDDRSDLTIEMKPEVPGVRSGVGGAATGSDTPLDLGEKGFAARLLPEAPIGVRPGLKWSQGRRRGERRLGMFVQEHPELAVERARAVGAGVVEIDAAPGCRPGQTKRECQTTLVEQLSLGLASPDGRRGVARGPQL